MAKDTSGNILLRKVTIEEQTQRLTQACTNAAATTKLLQQYKNELDQQLTKATSQGASPAFASKQSSKAPNSPRHAMISPLGVVAGGHALRLNIDNVTPQAQQVPTARKESIKSQIVEESFRSQTQLAQRAPGGAVKTIDNNALVPVSSEIKNKVPVAATSKAHHTMEAEEPFTSEFSRWIHGGRNPAAARRRNEAGANAHTAINYNSCAQSTGQVALEASPGPKATTSRNRLSCEHSPLPAKQAANATPLAHGSCRVSIDSPDRQGRDSPTRHWQQAVPFVSRHNRASPASGASPVVLRRGQPSENHSSIQREDVFQHVSAMRQSLNISRNSQADVSVRHFDRSQNASPNLCAHKSSPDKRASLERLPGGQKSQFAQINGQIILNLNNGNKIGTQVVASEHGRAQVLPEIVGASISAENSAQAKRNAAERSSMVSTQQAANAGQSPNQGRGGDHFYSPQKRTVRQVNAMLMLQNV